MRFLKTNTATRITVGPFLDKTDGITPEVALTVTSEKLTFILDDAGVPTLILDVAPTASGGANDMVHITGDDSGYYDLELAAADVNYLGRAVLSLNDVATHLPVFHEFMILSGQAYDSMFGTGNLSADVKAVTTGVDFSATMKASITAAVPTVAQIQAEMEENGASILDTLGDRILGTIAAGTHNPQSGDSYPLINTELADLIADIGANGSGLTAIPWNAAWDAEVQSECADAIAADASIAAILVDTGTTLDGRIPAALVSGKMDASVGAVAAGAITNAGFNADVGSTAFATNIIALAVFKALDSAITDGVSLTAGGLLEKVRKLTWVLANKVEVTDANGNTVIYKDDSTTAAYTVNAALTDDSTTTTRLRMA